MAPLLTFLVLICLALPFAEAYALSFRVQKLNEATRKTSDGCIKLDSSQYDMFTETPRNYSLIVVATALDPKMGCEPCRAFDAELRLASYSYLASNGKAPAQVYFASLDFNDGRDTFTKLRLQSAPVVMHFPPTEGPHGRGDKADMESYGMSSLDGDDFANWVRTVTKTSFEVKRPFNYGQMAINVGLLGFVLAIGKLLWSKFHSLVSSYHLWAVLSLVFMINMNSGYMFNSIRGTPYSGMGQNGKLEIIAGGFMNQYQIETQIVSILYGSLAMTVVFLTQRVPALESAGVQRVALYAGLAALLLLYSFLLNLFRAKNGGYPFRLLL